MAQQASIVVGQYKDWSRVPATTRYRVVQTVNTTVHEIGERLVKSDLDALIGLGIRVTIKDGER